MSILDRIRLYMEVAAPITDKGTYFGIKPLMDCRTKIHEWAIAHKLPRAILPGFYHTTILETEVPDLTAPPLVQLIFKIPFARIVLARFGSTISLSFKSSTIKARHDLLNKIATDKARATRQIIKSNSFNSHLAITDAGSSISDARLAQLNKAWDIDLIFGHEFTNPLHLTRSHVFALDPNKDQGKAQMMKERDRLIRMQNLKDKRK